MNNITFGECLKNMLLALNLSMSRLAKSIHVDSSLVNRWVHGERIPPYDSPYIENIAVYLSKNVKNEYQVDNINDILIKQGMNFDNLNNMYEKIKRSLLEAQGCSFQKKHLKEKDIKLKEKTLREEKKQKIIHSAVLESDTMDRMLQNKGLHEIVELSCNDKVIFCSDNIEKHAIDMLHEALSGDFAENKVVYMTYNNNLARSKDEITKIRDYFLKVISRGWKVIILMRIDCNLSRILGFSKFAIPLLIQGGLTIYYYTKYGLIGAERETFVVPQVGAISSFANSHNTEINTAFYLKSCSAVTVFEEYFKILMKSNAKQLIKYYSRKECMEYCNSLTECEESVGNRMVFKSNLSTIVLPEHVYEKLLKKSGISDVIRQFALMNFKKQCNAFKKNVKHYDFKEIYLMDSISNLIKNQEFYLYYYYGIKKVKLDMGDIVELLENIVRNLKLYKNYYISFVNKKCEDLNGFNKFSFVLKERKALFYENYDLENNYPSVRISIDEPYFINAYGEFFKKNWDHISPLHKEKLEMIKFLKRHINVLKR